MMALKAWHGFQAEQGAAELRALAEHLVLPVEIRLALVRQSGTHTHTHTHRPPPTGL